MKIMYVISPDFLLPFEEQSNNYTFNIKGFRLFVDDAKSPGVLSAKKELYKTNINDIVGFIILVDDISFYINELNEFLEEADNVCKGHERRVVIGSMSSKGDRSYNNLLRAKNLKLFKISGIEILTDHIVRQELFGTIIKGVAPYDFMTNKSESVNYTDIPKLKYRPVFSGRMLSVLSDVMVISDDFNKVLSYDNVYRNLLDEEDRVLAFIRMVKIATDMGLRISKADYEKVKPDIESSQYMLLYKGLLRECGGYYE